MTLSQVAGTSPSVGVSVSESPDSQFFGLSDGHLRDAMAEIALELLQSGISLAYGGDLRRFHCPPLLVQFRLDVPSPGTVGVCLVSARLR